MDVELQALRNIAQTVNTPKPLADEIERFIKEDVPHLVEDGWDGEDIQAISLRMMLTAFSLAKDLAFWFSQELDMEIYFYAMGATEGDMDLSLYLKGHEDRDMVIRIERNGTFYYYGLIGSTDNREFEINGKGSTQEYKQQDFLNFFRKLSEKTKADP